MIQHDMKKHSFANDTTIQDSISDTAVIEHANVITSNEIIYL